MAAPEHRHPFRPSSSRRVAPGLVVPLWTALLCLGATGARADGGGLLWRYPGIENVVSLAWIEDLDGDDLPDVIFETYDAGAPQEDHLYAVRGASAGPLGEIIWSIRPPGGPSNSGGYGDNCLRTCPDLDGDDISDVLLGTAWGGRTAYAISGVDGTVIWSFDTYSESPPNPPASGWVYGIDWIGDNTGDGVPEVIFCVGSDNNGIYCANGATGDIVWYMEGPDAFYDCRNVGDIDGDGSDDAAFGSGDLGPKLIVASGPGDGNGGADVIWDLNYNDSIFSLAPFPSMDGDGVPEIVAGAWDNTVKCHRGTDGQILWTAPIGAPVMRVAVADDVNDDGTPDIAVASWASAAKLVDGATGVVLWSTPMGDDVWAIDAVGDATGDGIGDVAAGSFDRRIYLLNGVDGSIAWFYPTDARLMTVRGTPDLDGNGVPDVIGGTQMLSGIGGDTYALQGGEISASAGDGAYPLRLSGSPGLKVSGPLAVTGNQPNPFASSTRWKIELARAGLAVSLEVIDGAGRRVRRLNSAPVTQEGVHIIGWDGRDGSGSPAPSGIYFLRLTSRGHGLSSEKAVRIR